MADKFPEIDVPVEQDELSEDFLTREKEILGDDAEQFKTEQDEEYLHQDEDDDVKQFEQQFPDVEENVAKSAPVIEDEEEEFSEPAFNPPKTESDAVKEWRDRYSLEIQQRDESNEKKTKETREAASKELDTFYEEYNNKKDENIEKVRAAESAFLEKRDEFYSNGNVWTRAQELIKGAKTNHRFKELLEAKARALSD
jgi:hypothetical protein